MPISNSREEHVLLCSPAGDTLSDHGGKRDEDCDIERVRDR